MKYKDYARLSKISLKARKKTTKSTVRGISFGLILLMPLLFIVIAFYIDLNKEVDKDASIRVFDITFVDERSNESYASAIIDEYKEDVYSIDGIENVIEYNNYLFENSFYDYEKGVDASFSVTLGSKTFKLNHGINESDYYNGYNTVAVQALDMNNTDNLFMKSDYEILNGRNPLYAGNTFSEDSRKEIMVSSDFLEHYNLLESDVIGKNITISYFITTTNNVTSSKTEYNSNLNFNVYGAINIASNFEIVGVFDSGIFKSPIRNTTQDLPNYGSDVRVNHNTYFWITTDSLYNSKSESTLPEEVVIEEETTDGYVHTQSAYYYQYSPSVLARNASDENCAFIPIGMGVRTSSDGNNYGIINHSLIEFESYKDANNAVNIIDSLYEKSTTSNEDVYTTSNYMSATFENYRLFYNIFTYVCIALAIFGGIVFFATLLNLYNTIHYSVQSRRNYIGMLRAIGMKSKSVVALYFVEIFQIFKRSYIWTAIFGGGICFGLSMIFKSAMESEYAQIITIDLSLNPIFILVAFIVLVIVNMIISVIFALVACSGVSKKPVLDVLISDK